MLKPKKETKLCHCLGYRGSWETVILQDAPKGDRPFMFCEKSLVSMIFRENLLLQNLMHSLVIASGMNDLIKMTEELLAYVGKLLDHAHNIDN